MRRGSRFAHQSLSRSPLFALLFADLAVNRAEQRNRDPDEFLSGVTIAEAHQVLGIRPAQQLVGAEAGQPLYILQQDEPVRGLLTPAHLGTNGSLGKWSA